MMNKISTAKLFAFIAAFIVTFLFASLTHASEPNSSSSADPAKTHGITFPVAELGNCASLSECKTYCQDLTNKDACIAFAKKKGFYKAPPPKRKTATESAKLRTVLSKAKEFLGCDSEEACKTFCSDSTNFAKCAEFARAVLFSSDDKKEGSRSGEERKGPPLKEGSKSGNSRDILKAAFEKYCKDNPTKCNTQDFCKDHPDACKMPQGEDKISSNSTRPTLQRRADDVKGVSTASNLFQQIYHFFFK